MPRITTGSAKNRNIKVPDLPNMRTVQDVAKLAIFAIIGEKVIGAKCLDLYAGSGSLGLEALSRGAGSCDFVDESRKAVSTIKDNIKAMGFENKGIAHQDNAIKFVGNTDVKYDLIFIDPFFDDVKHKFLFQNVEGALSKEGIIVFSHGSALDINEQTQNTNLKQLTQRKYGQAYITLLTH